MSDITCARARRRCETYDTKDEFVRAALKQSRDPCLQHPQEADGGARRDRTDDLKLAKLALSQLSYGP